MHTFFTDTMAEEIKMVRALQDEARQVPEEEWADWVNLNRDKVRLSGSDGYVPDQQEWIKRCASFLASMGSQISMPGR